MCTLPDSEWRVACLCVAVYYSPASAAAVVMASYCVVTHVTWLNSQASGRCSRHLHGTGVARMGAPSLSIGFLISVVTVLSCGGEFVKVLNLPSVGKPLNLFGDCAASLQGRISQRFTMADAWNAWSNDSH